mmetsp:Transcript_32485/g.64833  ORF Transcript_32485/g.64833 Transcript_32485/m.64833 type:complete len:239 (+) Transcript_32485:213-929(+)
MAHSLGLCIHVCDGCVRHRVDGDRLHPRHSRSELRHHRAAPLHGVFGSWRGGDGGVLQRGEALLVVPRQLRARHRPALGVHRAHAAQLVHTNMVPARAVRHARARDRGGGHGVPDHDPQGPRARGRPLARSQHGQLRHRGRRRALDGDLDQQPVGAVLHPVHVRFAHGHRHHPDPSAHVPRAVHGQETRQNRARRCWKFVLGGVVFRVRGVLFNWRQGHVLELLEGLHRRHLRHRRKP